MDNFKQKSDEQLKILLYENGIDKEIIAKVINSGYTQIQARPFNSDNAITCVFDTFYGSKWEIGFIPIPLFIDYLLDKNQPSSFVHTFNIKSLGDLLDILNGSQFKNAYENGRLSFRGQTKEYMLKRSVPNPCLSNKNGEERLVIPSYWRKFQSNWNSRYDSDGPISIFKSMIGDPLIYYGIDDWQNLYEKNCKRYGPFHTISDLEEFPDEESQEYYKRWLKHKILKNWSDIPLVEQHYGFETCGLDVTFDPKIALFFSTNRWVELGKKATYKAIDAKEHKGVVYSFLFTDPPLIQTIDQIKEIDSFSHIPPIRPLVQKCALPQFFNYNINEAVADLVAVFYIDQDFDMTDIPPAKELFPDENKDPFYAASLETRRSRLGIELYNKFIEYTFE